MTFEKDGYVHVKGMISKDICDIVRRYTLYDRYNNFTVHEGFPGTHCQYADNLSESLLMFLKPEIEKYTQMKIIPTYSYFRVYGPGDYLFEHIDLKSCEISASVTFAFDFKEKSDDYSWPLYVYNTNNEKSYLNMDVGDAVIYKGCEVKHGRDYLVAGKGSYQIQYFFHYVDANGPYADEFKYDKRVAVGTKKRKYF